MTKYDLIVVGAGPAGASLALHMAHQGHSVALIDGATFPRRKVCGEGLMPHGLEALRALGLEPQGASFCGLRYVLPDGTRAEASFPGGALGLGVQRTWLDFQLVQLAERHPRIDVRLGTWVQGVELPAPGSDERVQVQLGEETLTGEVLVGADGGRSRIRRLAGLEAPPSPNPRFGVACHVIGPADDHVEVSLGDGYEVYTTPVSQNLSCVALLTDREGLRPLQGDLSAGLRGALRARGGRCRELADAPFYDAPRALGPLALQATRAHADRLILIGDAAGARDPITGEGVSLALVTSVIASEVLAAAFSREDFSARSLAAWTRRRASAVRGLSGLTQALLFLARKPARAERVVRTLARSPETFERLLGVAAGTRSIASLPLSDGVRLLFG